MLLQYMLTFSLQALAAPFALPKGISLGSRLLHSILNPSPKGTRTPLQPSTNPTLRPPLVPQDSASTALWRVLLVSLSLSLTVYAILLPPHNLFLSLSMPRNIFERVLPALRSPLDIRTATESLARAWSVRLGGRALANDEISLLNRLQTLDARLIYVAYGTSPVMSCTWCRPGANWDYLVLIAPGVTLEYLLVLAVVGALLNRHRKHWRRWAVAVLLVGGAIEAALRLNWQGSRGGAVVMVSAFMPTTIALMSDWRPDPQIHSILHLYRHALFSATIVVAYFLPPKPIPQHPSASHLIAPVLSDLTSRAELVLNKLRVAKVQRMVVMQDAQTCNTVRYPIRDIEGDRADVIARTGTRFLV